MGDPDVTTTDLLAGYGITTSVLDQWEASAAEDAEMGTSWATNPRAILACIPALRETLARADAADAARDALTVERVAKALHDSTVARFGGCPTRDRRAHDAAHEVHAAAIIAALTEAAAQPEAQRFVDPTAERTHFMGDDCPGGHIG